MSLDNKYKITGDLRPSDYEMALISKHVYSIKDTTLEVGSKFETPFRTWTILFVSARSYCGYFGAVYECKKTKQYVIAHRGTNDLFDFIEDYVGVFKNRCSNQKTEAFRVVELIVKKVKNEKELHSISFTGHSLGAFLAELSVYFATVILNFTRVNAVTFESPGSIKSMKSFDYTTHQKSDFYSVSALNTIGIGIKSISTSIGNLALSSSSSLPSLTQSDFPAEFNTIVKNLDIITYVSYPNLVNTVNQHGGTLYAINVLLENREVIWPYRLVVGHSILGIVDWFERLEAKDPRCICLYMADWPKKYFESQVFFKYATYEEGVLNVNELVNVKNSNRPQTYVPSRYLKAKNQNRKLYKPSKQFEKWIEKQMKKFELKHHGKFNVVQGLTSPTVLPLHHFSENMQNFLQYFHKKRKFVLEEHKTRVEEIKRILKRTWMCFEMDDKIAEELLEFEVQKNSLSLEEVICKKVNVHLFRQQLSCFLERSGFNVDDLMDETILYEDMKIMSKTRPPQELSTNNEVIRITPQNIETRDFLPKKSIT